MCTQDKDGITSLCLHTFTLFWSRKTSVIIKISQLNFCVFVCAFPLEISSFFVRVFPLFSHFFFVLSMTLVLSFPCGNFLTVSIKLYSYYGMAAWCLTGLFQTAPPNINIFCFSPPIPYSQNLLSILPYCIQPLSRFFFRSFSSNGYWYKRKTWKGKIIENMLKRRKESGTYLATDSRHCWSVQMTMKNDNQM
jgi:hypothetical protein